MSAHSHTPYDGKWTWVLHFLARQRFTVSESEEYVIETQKGRDGYSRNDITTTTNRIEPIFKNTIILY